MLCGIRYFKKKVRKKTMQTIQKPACWSHECERGFGGFVAGAPKHKRMRTGTKLGIASFTMFAATAALSATFPNEAHAATSALAPVVTHASTMLWDAYTWASTFLTK